MLTFISILQIIIIIRFIYIDYKQTKKEDNG